MALTMATQAGPIPVREPPVSSTVACKQPESGTSSPAGFTIKTTEGRGLGIYATRTIRAGERILEERPLLAAIQTNGESNLDAVLSIYRSLSVEKQQAYLSLHPAPDLKQLLLDHCMQQSDDHELADLVATITAILKTNSFTFGRPRPNGRSLSVVFNLGSRFNHSCTPNAIYSYNTTTWLGAWHALRDIAEGEEMVISYIGNNLKPTALRQMQLDHYEFTCACSCCGDDASAKQSAHRRERANRLLEDMEFYGRRHRAGDCVEQGPMSPTLYESETHALEPGPAVEELESLLLAERLFGYELLLWCVAA